jgi:sugar transferase (PEP-CTERM system associated)
MIRIFNHSIPKLIPALILFDSFILIGSLYAGAFIRFSEGGYPTFVDSYGFFFSSVLFSLVMVLSMCALGIYHLDFQAGIKKTFIILMLAFLSGTCIISLIFYLIPGLNFGHGILAIGIIISAVLILMLRECIFKSYKFRFIKSRIIFLGGGALAEQCRYLALNSIFYPEFDVVGFVPIPSEECHVSSSDILPAGESLVAMARRYRAKEIVVSVLNKRNASFPIDDLLQCKLHGIKVTAASTFFEREACQIRVDSLQPSWLVFSDGFDQSFMRTFIKRTFDLIVSVVMLICSFPIMVVTAIYIVAEDRGPVFYRQERVGKDGKTFSVLKFRSMRNNAEQEGKPQWAALNDDRTTKVGRFIRKVRIDELPQILNVLKGEMSFVGPRPERPHFVKELSRQVPFYDMRHSVKPGITGFAQVRYQYGASVEDAVQKLQYDLYYVKNNSLFLDLLILIDTVQVVLLSKGSR